MAKLFTYLFFFLAIFLMISPALSLPLERGFYQKTCPSAEAIVRSTVKTTLINDPGAAAALIRLHFHDCFVRGCDASLLLDSTPSSQAEKARDSVTHAGGLYYDVASGRRDGRVSSIAKVTKNLPDAFFNVTELKENFARKGLSVEEMVTLSGVHSIGDLHCSSFSKRLYSFNRTFAQDPSMDRSYASFLKNKCPRQLKTR
ncbi:hypothetical protein CRYUN_Cryun17cG0057100 [Craigia yunnanensis]